LRLTRTMMGFSLIAAGSEMEASPASATIDAMTGCWVVGLTRRRARRTSAPSGILAMAVLEDSCAHYLTDEERRSMVGRRSHDCVM
jgi:hypothetical protein